MSSATHLVLKLPLIYDFAAGELRREAIWLDRLSNGLLSRAAHEGLFERPLEAGQAWLCLRPLWSHFDSLWVWADNEGVDWKSLRQVLGEKAELRFPERHALSEAELRAGQKAFPGLGPWKQPELGLRSGPGKPPGAGPGKLEDA